jgi:hypothetical protein
MQRAVVTDDVLCHEEAGEAFLLHVPTGRYYGLNPAGLEVWNALAAGRDPVEALRRRWPANPSDICRADAERLLDALLEAGLVEPADEAAHRPGPE